MHPASPNARLASGTRLALIGAIVNVVLAMVKIASGILGNSYALIADGVESTLDIFGSLLVWAGLRLAALPPDDTHPYGHGKAETLAAIAVGVLLLGTSVLLAIQSIREILTPHHAPAPFTLAILVGVIIIKELLFRKVLRHSNELGSMALESDAWHHRSDAITSVAAFLGITVALVGGPGFEAADDYGALIACAVIAFNGIRVLGPALNEAMDTDPGTHIHDAVRTAAATVAGVEGIEKCKIRKMGVEFYVDLHVFVQGDLPVRDGHTIAHAVKDAIRERMPSVADVLVHIEPFIDAQH
ncbi:MAG: cation diffusion facilitator family transporter [Verrucomicrobiota bacterium]|nr:cation diffusion facilitator family transporter [Chthoniobacteraceae bacterium]NBV32829.1 cation transporter [Pseudomonadota bacterium]